MNSNLHKQSAVVRSQRSEEPKTLNSEQQVRARKLAAREEKYLLSTKYRVRGLAMVAGLDRPKFRIAPAFEFPTLAMPKPKPADLTALKIDESILVDGAKYVVNRLTYRYGKCIAELRDRRGDRLWVGEGQLFELRRDIGPHSFRIRHFQMLRRPEQEDAYV